MGHLNRAILTGRLTADPEVRYTTNELPVARFSLAIPRAAKKGEKEVDFINCVAWRGLSKICGEYLKKGKLVYYRPAYITWKCEFKLSFSYLTKGVIPCESPILVTAFVRAHFDGQGVPAFEVNWSGPLIGTGKNDWRGVSTFSKDFYGILTRFIPTG